MSEIALRGIYVNCASRAQAADDAEAKRGTPAQSGLNRSSLKLSRSNPPYAAADARRACPRWLWRAGGAVPVPRLGSTANLTSNPHVGQERARASSPQAKSGRMTPRLRRALEMRVASLVEKQAAAAAQYENMATVEYGALDERADAVLVAMADRQQRLRSFRELLLHSGNAASSSWLPQEHVANGGSK